MKAIQDVIISHSIPANHVFNEDETAIESCAELLYQNVPKGTGRAVDPSCGSESRFTAVLGCNGEGQRLPTLIILKVSTQSTFDLRSERTLHPLMADLNRIAGAEVWSYSFFPVTVDGKDYFRPYIQHQNLDLITVQHKAWNDQVGQLLRIEKQLKPYKQKLSPEAQTKFLMVYDNVSFHNTNQVVNAFQAADWFVKNWAPNMTDELQPMDLVENKVFKSAMRDYRASQIYDYLQEFRSALCEFYQRKGMGIANTEEPIWTPPKTTYKQTVPLVFKVLDEKYADPKFVTSLKTCFVSVGLAQKLNIYGQLDGFVTFNRKIKCLVDDAEFTLENHESNCFKGWLIDCTTKRDDPDEAGVLDDENGDDHAGGEASVNSEESEDDENGDDHAGGEASVNSEESEDDSDDYSEDSNEDSNLEA
jgi:hypothetical protein